MHNAAPAGNASLWCSRTIIVSVRGPGDEHALIRVPRPFARIGSDRRADVCLALGDLLPCHLYLHATDTGIYCLGLAETAPSGWLTPAKRVEIGPYRIKANFDDGGPAPIAGESRLHKKGLPGGLAPQLRITGQTGARASAELLLDRQLAVVGRRSPSHWRIADTTVSRVHCALYWSGDALWAIDLLSGNGTRVGEEPIDARLWNPGQNLVLGKCRLRYLLHEQLRAAPISRAMISQTVASPSDLRSQIACPKASSLVSPSQEPTLLTNDERAESERQLLLVLHAIGVLDLQEDGGPDVLPEAFFEAFSAIVEEMHTGTQLATTARATPRDLIDEACRALCQASPTDYGVRRIEHERPAVSLTIVNHRQMVESPRPRDCDRLIDAIRDLEGRLAQLIQASEQRYLRAAGRVAQPALEGEHPMPLLSAPARQLQAIAAVSAGEEFASAHPPSPAIAEVSVAAARSSQALAEANATGFEDAHIALEVFEPGGLDADHAGQLAKREAPCCSSLASDSLATDSVPRDQGDEAHGHDPSSATSTPRAGANAAAPVERPFDAAAGPPGALLDDQMFQRLMSFKAKREGMTQGKKIFWSAAAAVAIVFSVAAFGAAKLWFVGADREPGAGGTAAAEFLPARH